MRPELELFLPHRLDIDTSGLVIVGELKPSRLPRFLSVGCCGHIAPAKWRLTTGAMGAPQLRFWPAVTLHALWPSEQQPAE